MAILGRIKHTNLKKVPIKPKKFVRILNAPAPRPEKQNSGNTGGAGQIITNTSNQAEAPSDLWQTLRET